MLKTIGKSWKQKKYNDKNFIVKILFDKGAYKFCVSDMVYLWTRTYTEPDLASVCEALNPLFESDSGSLVSKALALLDDHFCDKGGDLQVMEGSDNSLLVKLKARLEGIVFKFEVELEKQSPQVFYEELFAPFVRGAEELLCRQNQLCSILEAKDQEIAEYELEGARLTRRNIKTPLFSREEFLSQSHSKSIKAPDLQYFLDTVNILKEDMLNETPGTRSPEKPQPSKKEEPSSHLVEDSVEKECMNVPAQSVQVKKEDNTEPRPLKKKRTQLRL